MQPYFLIFSYEYGVQIFWNSTPLPWGFSPRSSPLGACIHFRIGQHRTPYHEFIRLYLQCRLCWHHFSWRNCMDLQLVFRFGGGQTKGHDRRRQWDCKLLIFNTDKKLNMKRGIFFRRIGNKLWLINQLIINKSINN